jgi:hypothetical protein
MTVTAVGLFRTRLEAESALRKLEQAGFTSGDISIVTPRRTREGRWWAKLMAGLVVGTAVGAIVGAVVTGMVPGVHPMMSGNMLLTFLFVAFTVGAAGGLAGMLLGMAASGGGSNLYYEQEIESGRFLVKVISENPAKAVNLLEHAGAMEASPLEAPVEALNDAPERIRRGRPRSEGG